MKWFRNLKLKVKMILSFGIVAILCGCFGLFAVTEIVSLNDDLNHTFEYDTTGLAYMCDLLNQYVDNEILLSGISEGDMDGAQGAAEYRAGREKLNEYINRFVEKVYTDRMQGALGSSKDARMVFFEKTDAYLDLIEQGVAYDDPRAKEAYREQRDASRAYNEQVKTIYGLKLENAEETALRTDVSTERTTFITIGVIVLLVVMAMVIGIANATSISRSTNALLGVAKEVGESGNLNFSQEQLDQIEGHARARDEIGQTMRAFLSMITTLEQSARTLEVISNGDLTHDIEVRSDRDTLGIALQSMQISLKQVFEEIRSVSHQVSGGSKLISDGAQALAQGTTEQASSVQQLASSVNMISEQTLSNATEAREASEMAKSVQHHAQTGNHLIMRMVKVMEEIDKASNEVQKVIKVIDDIAFQTNILALNASVEAARAGVNGRSFAVVAEEVKTLALQSQKAANETSDMIQRSLDTTKNGVEVSKETEAAFAAILADIGKIVPSVEGIATSSTSQAEAISQINLGLEQVSSVVQMNSASSEESAASSEEMASQSEILYELVSRFQLDRAG